MDTVEALNRKDLQALAKANKVPANKSSKVIIEKLLEIFGVEQHKNEDAAQIEDADEEKTPMVVEEQISEKNDDDDEEDEAAAEMLATQGPRPRPAKWKSSRVPTLREAQNPTPSKATL